LPDSTVEVPAGAEADGEQEVEPSSRLGAVSRGTGEDSAECTDAAEPEGEATGGSLEAAGPKSRKKRTESALSSPDSSAASTTSGGMKVGESSGAESQTSDDEKVRALSILTTVPSSSMTAVPSSVDEDTDFDGRSARPQRMSDGSVDGWMSGLLSMQSAVGMAGELGKVDEGDSGKWQWWRHLGEMNMQGAGGVPAPPQGESDKKKNKKNKQPQQPQAQWHNIQDLEGKLGWDADEQDCGAKPVDGFSFASRSTSAIAARVARLCLGHVAYQ